MLTNISKSMLERMIGELEKTRAQKRVIDCITNNITVNDCANAILAIGASPIMSDAMEEIDDIVSVSSAVLLNTGGLQPFVIHAMEAAGKKANELNKPVILDPVGAGASRLRDRVCKTLTTDVHPCVIRGNLSEILALGGYSSNTQGVDASADDKVTLENLHEQGKKVQRTAKQFNCTVCATGEIDIIASPAELFAIQNGHEMLECVTGTGCMCSALVAALCAGSEDITASAAAGVLAMCLAGEIAYEYIASHEGCGSGTFHVKLIDALNLLSPQDILQRGRIYEL